MKDLLLILNEENKIKIINLENLEFTDIQSQITYKIVKLEKGDCDCGAKEDIFEVQNSESHYWVESCGKCINESLNINDYDNCGWHE